MDAIEKAIRNAFAKGDPADRAFREKVYRSAFAALDRAIAVTPNIAPEMADLRRRHLTARIADIESEHIPAVAAEPVARPTPVPPREPAAARPIPTVEAAPQFANDRADDSAPAPVLADVQPQRHDFDYEVDTPELDYRRPVRRGRPWIAMFIGALAVSAIFIGLWWAVGSGLFLSPGERDQSVPNPPQVTEDEDFDPDRPAEPALPDNAADLADWLIVFDPSDPITVTAPGDSSAQAMEGESGSFMRIGSGASGSPVLFDVGQGVLEQLAGRRAVFNIVAERPDEGETQIAVDCNLAELGDCGRKRYIVGVTREEFLFEVDMPDAQPGAGGTIAISADVDGSGKTVDIYAIRVSPAE